MQLKQNNFVPTFAEQRTRYIEVLLRPCLPVPSKIEAVDPGYSFIPAVKPQERVRRGFCLEISPVEGWPFLRR
nr:hypothetical protein [Paenibacillus albidus]